MAETQILDGKSGIRGSIFEEVDEEDTRNSALFLELKHSCVQLLDLLRNPDGDPSFLSHLLHLLQKSSTLSLQPLFDFILFPLLLLFDASVECRSSTKTDSKDDSLVSSTLLMEHKVSDSVTEGVVLCLEEVLKKCQLGSIDQLVVILKKLTLGAMLSPLEASEEFREGVIRCFRAVLLNLGPCSDDSCPCKGISNRPILPDEKEWQFPGHISVSKECPLAFLQSQPASAAIGHWLSLMLKAADIEVTRGHRGSSSLRVEALMTLRVLIAKVGSADALAFYLPGVVSQLGKVLHTSRSMISGAAGSTKALDQAVRALAEYLVVVLDDGVSTPRGAQVEDISGFSSTKEKPLASFLEELRHLPAQKTTQGDIRDSTESIEKGSIISGGDNVQGVVDLNVRSLHVNRTEEWLANTAAHVNKLLCATFPLLCVHPSKNVRLGLLASLQGLLCKCSYTLKESRLTLLECLCVLVCDDLGDVSSSAQAFFGLLISSKGKHQTKHEVVELFRRLIEKLPQVVLGNEESLALSHARKLLAITYFGGPKLVTDYLLLSPVTAACFLDVFALCLSQNSVYAGSLNKLAAARPTSSGFMHSIAEIQAITSAEGSQGSGFQNRKISNVYEHGNNEYKLPSIPPWLTNMDSQKLYQTLSGILRLVSLYVLTDSRSQGSYSGLIDILLEHFRKLISELRLKELHKESWQSWYKRMASGHLVRQASTAACILNEMIFGLSDPAMTSFGMFGHRLHHESNGIDDAFVENHAQEKYQKSSSRAYLIDCIGSILHEYLSPEVWDLPLRLSASPSGEGDVNMHFFSDCAMLQQVIIEGIGIFNICLGKEFSSCGFLHSSLYMLLENIVCSDFQVRRAADTVLHVISATHNCPTVGHLVVDNSDYVIDSVCRQLRHLDCNPHVPNVLSAVLSYVGIADKILPLLEEPMHAVSMELEILGRHHHPNLTVPFLKAVAELAKASKREAGELSGQLELYKNDVNSKMWNEEKRTGNNVRHSESNANNLDSEIDEGRCAIELESVVFKFNDSKRYRRIVGSIAGSCIVAVTPLIASSDATACLTALDIVEDGITTLVKVEEAYKHESETKEAIEQVIQSCSLYHLLDTLGAAEDEASENRSLPAMNKIWPYLITCFRNKNLVAIRRCCRTISTVVHICGGEFFARRFHTDGVHIWRLLSTSPFQKKTRAKEERTPLQLPYRTSLTSSEDSPAELSTLKVQVAILDMISDLARSKRSAPALEPVLKKVSGVVVGMVCSGVKGLQDACANALVALASIDPDLIWLLLADVYYSRVKSPPPPPSGEFPEISEVLPSPPSLKHYLYVLYAGQSYGFDVDFAAVETALDKLNSIVFTSQMYK
ncbi:TELO2-interacting protein 1 homolog isoform X1 [Salvia splendens]|uniref:TELO2-interacting protein 1 homolog isoform X1 n=2 Tax=Salvia splendens TaxID=180675 RepID=UPI001C280D1C|nr:TELO2-interacting protein 1 homolog isoform X1 [Salvia splendens]